jgi:hypothetical protein
VLINDWISVWNHKARVVLSTNRLANAMPMFGCSDRENFAG